MGRISSILTIVLIVVPIGKGIKITANGTASRSFKLLSASACKTSLWDGITESMIKTSNPTATNLSNARLNCCGGAGKDNVGGWCGDTHGGSEHWIEVDFSQGAGIRGVVIQPPENAHGEYVKTISIQFMFVGTTQWQYVSSDPTKPQEINALVAQTDSVNINIQPGLAVSKFRINILSYNKSPCLRFDLLGCSNYNDLCPNSCLNGGQCYAEDTCSCLSNYNGVRCENPISNAVCDTPLGMQSGAITNDMISVSSSETGKTKEKVRYGCCAGEDNGAWCPAPSDRKPWIEIRLPKPMALSGLNFEHPSQKDTFTYPSKFMKTFQLKFQLATDPLHEWKIFNENIPSIYNSTIYYNIGLELYIVTDAIRIYPETYESTACFRVELIGCDPAGLCQRDFCKNGGTCMGTNVCKCLSGFYGESCDQSITQMIHLNFGFTQIVQHIIQTTVNINLNTHGIVTLVSSPTGNAVQLTGNSYVTVNNTGFNACLKDITSCTSGFTLSLNVNLQHALANNAYIVSSGGDLEHHTGIAFYHNNHELHFVVTTTSKKWIITIPNTLTLNTCHNILLSWSTTSGSSLVIDGHLVGSIIQSQPTVATQSKPLSIGFGYHQRVPIYMTFNGLEIFDSDRETLIQNGLLSTAKKWSACTSSNPGQTTSSFCNQRFLDFTFNGIDNNILLTPSYNFTLYGKPTLTPEQNGKAILELHKNGQYAELPNHRLECIQDMAKCEQGFTLSAEIKLMDLNSTDKRYIFSSGGDQVGASGLALFLWHGELYCSTKKDNLIWTAKHRLNVGVGEWHTYQVSWNKNDGFIVYLDGKEFMSHSIKLPNPDQPAVYPLYIASAPNNTLTTTAMEVRSFFTWSASRDVLISQGCINEYSTTTTSKSTSRTDTSIEASSSKTPTTATIVQIQTTSEKGFSAEKVVTVGCNHNWNVDIYLPPLYSRYSDFNPGDIYLGQDSCTGYVDGNYLRFPLNYTTCGTTTMTTKQNVVHTNEIIYARHDPNNHFIIREYRLRIPVACYLPRNEETEGHYNHGHANTIPPAQYVTGSSHHTVQLQFYSDSSFQYTKPLYGSKVGDTVYVKATYADFGDDSVKMRLSDCFATPTSSAYSSSMQYFIIRNGCVIDPNARILSQSMHETRFYFQDFEYSTNRDSLYLHCNATFCKSNDYSTACEPTCHHKRLGGGNVVFEGPTENVDVNNAVRLANVDKSRNGQKVFNGNSTLLVVVSVVLGGILLVITISIVVGKIKRMRQGESKF